MAAVIRGMVVSITQHATHKGYTVTYCRVNATALLWRYPTPVEHPSSMAPLHVPFEPKPEAIGDHMQTHTTLNILPSRA